MNKISGKIFVYTDGGSRGNPGPAAYGFVAYDEQKNKLFEGMQFIGEKTNNQAEYRGVLGALEYIESRVKNNKFENVEGVYFFLDSKLIVEQMNGNFKIKNEGLKPLYWEIREKIMFLGGKVVFEHVRREKNKVADSLVNKALDEHEDNI